MNGQGKQMVGSDAIREYQFRVILRALKLQVDTGMRHSRDAATKSARNILKEAGKPAPRKIDKLHEAFRAHLLETKVISQ